MEPEKIIKPIVKQGQIKIEVVSNGYIVKENYYDGPSMRHPSERGEAGETKVFNTKQQLKNYIDKYL